MITLIGFGFVGKAYFKAFGTYHNMTIVDPKYTTNTIEEIKGLQSAIICVPTPSNEDGSCDMTIVYDTIKRLPESIPILIKSTVSLEGWQYIEENFPKHVITFSPEFLRAATADEDIRNLSHVILAGGNTDYWRDFYLFTYPEIKVTYCTPRDAIAIKYFRNAFLATKCGFFNEIYDFCNSLGLNYDCVRWGIAADPRIGESHTFINPEARGWGGMCFPKDTNALLKTAERSNINLNILEAAINYNNLLRKKP